MRTHEQVPRGLRTWFIVHFVVDLIFAVPLLVLPEQLMPVLGWSAVDPIAARLVGAALLAIGVTSWIERGAEMSVFRAMLNLKILWASAAIFAIALGITNGGAPAAWVFLIIFAGFLIVWVRYRAAIRQRHPRDNPLSEV